MTATLGPREQRIRPVRALEIAAVICLAALVLWVYVAKSNGADEAAAIRRVRADVAAEQRAIRLLEAEAAGLESPARLEALVREHSDMTAVDPTREARPEAIDGLEPGAPPAAAAPAAPAAPVVEAPR